MQMGTIDGVMVVLYGVGIFGLAHWVSRDKAGAGPKNTRDYFPSRASLRARQAHSPALRNSMPYSRERRTLHRIGIGRVRARLVGGGQSGGSLADEQSAQN